MELLQCIFKILASGTYFRILASYWPLAFAILAVKYQPSGNPTTRLATSKNFFLPRVNFSQGQCSLKFIRRKAGSEIPDHIKCRSRFDLKHLYKNCLLKVIVPR